MTSSAERHGDPSLGQPEPHMHGHTPPAGTTRHTRQPARSHPPSSASGPYRLGASALPPPSPWEDPTYPLRVLTISCPLTWASVGAVGLEPTTVGLKGRRSSD